MKHGEGNTVVWNFAFGVGSSDVGEVVGISDFILLPVGEAPHAPGIPSRPGTSDLQPIV